MQCRRVPSYLAVAVWIALTALGLGALSLYAFSGHLPAHAAQQWPAQTRVALDPVRPVLVLFLHPHCPCSSASITELGRVLIRYPGVFKAYAVLTVPPGAQSDWEAGRNLETARNLPEAELVFDRGGALACGFGGQDSGTLLVFASDGARLFAGGITASRGHEGESLGSLALGDIAEGRPPRQAESPVFGCPLLGPEESIAREGRL